MQGSGSWSLVLKAYCRLSFGHLKLSGGSLASHHFLFRLTGCLGERTVSDSVAKMFDYFWYRKSVVAVMAAVYLLKA